MAILDILPEIVNGRLVGLDFNGVSAGQRLRLRLRWRRWWLFLLLLGFGVLEGLLSQRSPLTLSLGLLGDMFGAERTLATT